MGNRLQQGSGAGVALMVLILALGACSGDDTDVVSDSPSTASASAPSAPSPTPSGTPTSTSATPRAIDASTQLREAQKTSSAAYLAAVAKPGSKARVDALLKWYVPGSAASKALAQRMKQLAEQGFAAKIGPKGYQVIESVSLNASGSNGTVTTCTFDDGVLYDTRHNDKKGRPFVVNDDVASRRTVSKWRLRQGRWQQTVATQVRSWPDSNHCPAKDDE